MVPMRRPYFGQRASLPGNVTAWALGAMLFLSQLLVNSLLEGDDLKFRNLLDP